MVKTVLTFIFVFGIIVLVHEFGHYYFAKKSGVMVREFAIGMGPKLFSIHKNSTTYTLRLLPLGGYVRMAGLGEDTDDLYKGMNVTLELDDAGRVKKINTSDKNLFQGIPLEVTDFDLQDQLFIEGNCPVEEGQTRFPVDHDALIVEKDGTEIQIAPKDVQYDSAKLGQRMMINFAGPMNNFILTILLLIVMAFMQGGVPDMNSTAIGGVQKESVAQKAGLQEGDKILSVNGTKVENWDDLVEDIHQSTKGPVKLEVETNKGKKDFTLTPKVEKVGDEKQGFIGIQPSITHSLWAKIRYGFTQTWSMTKQIFTALKDLVTGFSLNKLGGPVAIFKVSENVAKQGWIAILSFTAMLSLNIGIFNLIPIPALDGGKLLLNLYELIMRKPLDPKKEGVLTMIGFGVMIILMILVTWNDLRRYFF
ncbi:RIP metalloprotease RseP [Catellicoccus marimammalium]|uniref:Zinc metalloprotease n=1 Tax=Catellicoccus marimammalium M35/04/3 TaxID=1234409 RepID=K8ZPE9_9ENTE|nr:RIP metalloprotease RseP [Catellicoccus marimammalium]EKU27451.1 Membrane-associated zinc metalloprotease [Catellicoccus marimammalium M35/04/3]